MAALSSLLSNEIALVDSFHQDPGDVNEDLVSGDVAERVVDVLEPVEIERQQRASAFGVAIGLERLGQARGQAMTIGQSGHGIELRQPFGVEPAFATGRDVLGAAAVARETALVVELGFTGDFPPDFVLGKGQADIELADRVARAQQEGERALGLVGVVGPFGNEQFAQGFADRLAIGPAELLSGIIGQIDQASLRVGGPEPAESRGLETVEQFDPADGIGSSDRAQRGLVRRCILIRRCPHRSREEPCHVY